MQFEFAIMSDETKEQPAANELLKNSSLYREFQAEREEILKHKWIESEKAGRDIGFERALTIGSSSTVPNGARAGRPQATKFPPLL